MDDKASREDLEIASERQHFVRAALVAASLGVSEEELQDLRSKALWQMAAIYRNAVGTKILATQYGFSKERVRQILEQYLEENRKEGNTRPLELCYDYHTGEYLSFEEWLDQCLKNWKKL